MIMTIKELKEKRDELARKNRKEYETRGNTQKCQQLWAEIEKIDAKIEKKVKEQEG